ncbi:MAG: DUF4331 family protein [Blastocatellia bacterium]|nr:DUF4331 family protein [Blastocatellia bacterium]
MSTSIRRAGFVLSVTAVVLSLAFFSMPQGVTRAADHSEAPLADHDRPADIGDVYAFLDPSDNTKVVFAFTVVGFIVPSENANQGAFDSTVRYRLELEERATRSRTGSSTSRSRNARRARRRRPRRSCFRTAPASPR